ncbi:MAG: Holliday junction branch migration protein RuvA [Clostridia bacterium]|nr:Holliday junction branch migration protein RuvA [Clostridia bacterium]
MIYSVTGKPNIIDENTVAISNGAIAFEVTASTNTVFNLSRKTESVTLLTYLYVREDEMRLFGFENSQEKSLFLNLISVSGVGPKVAMSILSGMNWATLANAISTGNVKLLASIKGLGKKTAERIILELRDKLGIDGFDAKDSGISPVIIASPEMTDAVETLVLLGVNKQQANETVKLVAKEGMTAEEIVKSALTKL